MNETNIFSLDKLKSNKAWILLAENEPFYGDLNLSQSRETRSSVAHSRHVNQTFYHHLQHATSGRPGYVIPGRCSIPSNSYSD
ncbi:hypothetical protein RRG08_009876 [Elysia crispata]|uniref:Uncharacterized protein n=1 Tax=Elysia crispata TaxID=231223 RepID=A0AAE0Z3Z2_9GAST|nr:hypothetical protein RRG08_009876 [Elysia crispata]